MSRNGCVQTKSNAAFRIAARVRSDLTILADGWGLTCRGDIDSVFSDMMLEINVTLLDCQAKIVRRHLYGPFLAG